MPELRPRSDAAAVQASTDPPEPDTQPLEEPEPEPEPQPEIDARQLAATVDRLAKELDAERDNAKFLRSQLDRITPAALRTDANGNATTKPRRALPDDFAAKLFDPEQAETALADWAKAHGFVSATDVEKFVNGKMSEVARLNTYYQRHPDLNDPNSAVHKAALKYGAEVAADPEFSQLPEATRTRIALELASKEVTALGNGTKAKAAADAAAETDRKRRIAQQDGPRGGGRSQPAAGNDELTPEQKKAASNLGVSYEDYAKYAKRGVNVGPLLASALSARDDNQGGRR